LMTLPALACGWATDQIDIGLDSPPTQTVEITSVATITARPAEPRPTRTLEPLGESMRITGSITADIDGESRTWYTVLSPGIGGALVNSAAWADEVDAVGFYEADLQALAFQNQSYQQPTSTLRLQFPFTRDMEPGTIIRVPGPGGDRASAELELEGPGWSYEMVEGRIELERVTVRAEQAAFSGAFAGTLELVGVADGEPPWTESVEVQVGRVQIIRATAKSALPGGRPPEGE
ncbi:MAG: hypothetical protein R3191_07325, partial [Anaerolineales bacterium]|nr:hypothetical protein [Anaerolineales bacterium]